MMDIQLNIHTIGEAADKMDELITPIEVGEELKKLKEVKQQYGG